MEVKLDAIVAEIVGNIDFELLEGDPKFDSLPRSQRMHLVLRCLPREMSQGKRKLALVLLSAGVPRVASKNTLE